MVQRKKESDIRDRDREQNLDEERTASPMGGNRRPAAKKSSRATGYPAGRSKSRKKK